MNKFKKILLWMIFFLAMGIVTGCDNTTTTSKSFSKINKASNSKTKKEIDKSNEKKFEKKSKMNLNQIKAGNYSSIQDNWEEVAIFVNKQDGKGSVWSVTNSDKLTVTENMIQNLVRGDSKTLTKTGVSIENINTPVEYKLKQGYLSITCTTNNDIWSTSFYPKNVELSNFGTTPPLTVDNNKDRIVIGSKYYIQIFQRKENKRDISTKSKVNFESIKSGNFSSLMDGWKEVAYNERGESGIEKPYQTENKVLRNKLTIDKFKIWTNQVAFDTKEIKSDVELENMIYQVNDVLQLENDICNIEIIPAGVEMNKNYGVLPNEIDINKDRMTITWDGEGKYPIEIYQRE